MYMIPIRVSIKAIVKYENVLVLDNSKAFIYINTGITNVK